MFDSGACETGIAQNYQTHVTASSNCGPSFVIEAQSSEASNPGFIPPLGTPKLKYWKPLSIRRPIVVPRFILPLLFIALLEALQ